MCQSACARARLRVRCIMPSMHAFGYWTAHLHTHRLTAPVAVHTIHAHAGTCEREGLIEKGSFRCEQEHTGAHFRQRRVMLRKLVRIPCAQKDARDALSTPARSVPRHHAIPAPCAFPTSRCADARMRKLTLRDRGRWRCRPLVITGAAGAARRRSMSARACTSNGRVRCMLIVEDGGARRGTVLFFSAGFK